MNIPDNLKYTKDHEWARIEGKRIVVGITDHAQSALGDIVFLDLPKVGRVLKKGETFGVVESIKAVSDLYSPVNGTVTAVNSDLTADPAVLNRDPYKSGWLIEVELGAGSPPGEELMDAAKYTAFVQSLK